MTFSNDLKDWQKIEREFASRLMKWNVIKVEFPQWKFKDYDIKATFKKSWYEVEKTFEIKNDMVSDKTGNVWFEYLFRWEPSGIYTSKADYIVYKLGDKFYYIDRARLLIWLSKIDKTDVSWWDDNMAHMFLVKKEFFNSMAKEI
jgi:hypothetical protein